MEIFKGDNTMNKMKIKIHEKDVKVHPVLITSDLGSVEMDARFPGIFAFCPTDADGKNDDCTYYFSLYNGFIIQKGWNYGRGAFEPDMIKDDGPWLDNPDAMTDPNYKEGAFHNEEYQDKLLQQLCDVFALITY